MREQAAAALDLGDAARRQANLIRPGTVAEIDAAAARVRVRYGTSPDGKPALTAWLPWLPSAAGGYRDWRAPSAGEQVVLLAPCGELAAAFVLPGAYRDDFPAPESSADVRAMLCPDGARIEYDAEKHALSAVLPAGGKVSLKAPGGMTIEGGTAIDGDVKIDGDLSVTGAIAADGKISTKDEIAAAKKIASEAQVADKLGSMQQMRSTYNAHVHGVPPGFVTPPVAPASRMT